MEAVQSGHSDLFTAYGLESITSNLDVSNEVSKTTLMFDGLSD